MMRKSGLQGSGKTGMGKRMKGREFIATASDEKVGSYMNELIAHGQLCKRFCKGCKKAQWNCEMAVKNMLNSEVDPCYTEGE